MDLPKLSSPALLLSFSTPGMIWSTSKHTIYCWCLFPTLMPTARVNLRRYGYYFNLHAVNKPNTDNRPATTPRLGDKPGTFTRTENTVPQQAWRSEAWNRLKRGWRGKQIDRQTDGPPRAALDQQPLRTFAGSPAPSTPTIVAGPPMKRDRKRSFTMFICLSH
ncbi:hypothetical protein BKA61DRAFT_88954 [Leptodontidium sp. MPI-SDFR-AT-0119]|nr:hypothetical protein BKA61DRAFT_88954 [Leptodontidium sp. MPI-SDFR-AT-0119]